MARDTDKLTVNTKEFLYSAQQAQNDWYASWMMRYVSLPVQARLVLQKLVLEFLSIDDGEKVYFDKILEWFKNESKLDVCTLTSLKTIIKMLKPLGIVKRIDYETTRAADGTYSFKSYITQDWGFYYKPTIALHLLCDTRLDELFDDFANRKNKSMTTYFFKGGVYADYSAAIPSFEHLMHVRIADGLPDKLLYDDAVYLAQYIEDYKTYLLGALCKRCGNMTGGEFVNLVCTPIDLIYTGKFTTLSKSKINDLKANAVDLFVDTYARIPCAEPQLYCLKKQNQKYSKYL